MRINSIAPIIPCYHQAKYNFKLGQEVTWASNNQVLLGKIIALYANHAIVQSIDGIITNIQLYNLTVSTKRTLSC